MQNRSRPSPTSLLVTLILSFTCVVIAPLSFADQVSTNGWTASVTHSTITDSSGKYCSECGKKILFGSKCASCVAKTVKDKAKEIREKAKDTKKKFDDERNKRQHPCDKCGKTIHIGKLCSSCLTKIAKEKTRSAVEKAKDVGKRTQKEVREVYDKGRVQWKESENQRSRIVEDTRRMAGNLRRESRELLERRDEVVKWVARTRTEATVRYEKAARVYVPRIKRTITDPENQRRVIEAIGAAVEVHRRVKEAKRQATYQSLKLLGQVPVETDRGRMSLEELARAKMLEKIPSLRGTDIAEDPVAVTTAFICGDRGYFLTEMKIVKSGKQHVSIIEGMKESSQLDASNVLEYLNIIEATEDLANGENPIGAMDDIATAISKLTTTSKK